MTQFRPTLAESVTDVDALPYPMIGSPKLDGVRCVIHEGLPKTRKLELIPNDFIFNALKGLPPFDGELMVGNVGDVNGFDSVESAVMSRAGEPAFTYHVFDLCKEHDTFLMRVQALGIMQQCHASHWHRVRFVEQKWINNKEELLAFEEQCLADGYEGIVVRSPHGIYKHGRSTEKEALFLRMVRLQRAEVRVCEFIEARENTNEDTRSNLGLAKRSKAKAGMKPAGTLGALRCCWWDTKKYGVADFKVGTGTCLDDAARLHIWQNQGHYLGRPLTIEFRGITKTGKPRFPSAKGWRDPRDMGDPA